MTTTNCRMQTAMIALDHLTYAPEGRGINRVKAMLGATNIRTLEDGVDFRFKGSRRLNYCRITLNGDDLYDMAIGGLILRGPNMGTVVDLKSHTGMGAEDLRSTFRWATGLNTHL